MAFVAAISYGKDSLAMLEVIRQKGPPLDRIITVDEWATDTVRATLPEAVAFERRADAEIMRRYGLPVEHVRSAHTFESLFYSSMSRRSKRAGQIRRCWANSFLKIEPFRKAIGQRDVQYIGIAANEVGRIANHGVNPQFCVNSILGANRADLFRAAAGESGCRLFNNITRRGYSGIRPAK